MNRIPASIHLICADKLPPVKYQSYIDRMMALHPDWTFYVWDDATALDVVRYHFPEWLDIYQAFPFPVQRADIFRVMIVYLLGGFYLDLDMFCLRKLDDLCEDEIVLGIEKILSVEEAHQLHHRHPLRIANYMFGSRAGHGFWREFLYAARIKSTGAVTQEEDILEMTGPGLLTKVFHRVKHRYSDIVLLENNDRACPKSCGPASCHYGDYAVHYHVGSWRWESVLSDAINF